MNPAITSFQSSSAERLGAAMQNSLSEVIGSYQGRKITPSGKTPLEAGVEFQEHFQLPNNTATQKPAQAESRQAVDARIQKLRTALGRTFPELQGSANLNRLASLLRRARREGASSESLKDELDGLFPDPAVQHGVVVALSSEMRGGSGGTGGQNDDAMLQEHLARLAEELEKNHGDAIAAAANIAAPLGQFIADRPDQAGQIRNLYRDTVFNYTSPLSSYQFLAEHGSAFDRAPEPNSLRIAIQDGPELEKRLSTALDFLSSALSADLAAVRPSQDPSKLHDVLEGLQQVRALNTTHSNCRGLLEKFHASTNKTVPVAPYRLLNELFHAIETGNPSVAQIESLLSNFNVPPFEPSINFLTQLRSMVSGFPARLFPKPESRELTLDAMQVAIDQLIDAEEGAMQ